MKKTAMTINFAGNEWIQRGNEWFAGNEWFCGNEWFAGNEWTMPAVS